MELIGGSKYVCPYLTCVHTPTYHDDPQILVIDAGRSKVAQLAYFSQHRSMRP
jgi:hypothetical protein